MNNTNVTGLKKIVIIDVYDYKYLLSLFFFTKFCKKEKQFENKSRGHVTVAMSTFGTEHCKVMESINFLYSYFYNLRYISFENIFKHQRRIRLGNHV